MGASSTRAGDQVVGPPAPCRTRTCLRCAIRGDQSRANGECYRNLSILPRSRTDRLLDAGSQPYGQERDESAEVAPGEVGARNDCDHGVHPDEEEGRRNEGLPAFSGAVGGQRLHKNGSATANHWKIRTSKIARGRSPPGLPASSAHVEPAKPVEPQRDPVLRVLRVLRFLHAQPQAASDHPHEGGTGFLRGQGYGSHPIDPLRQAQMLLDHTCL
jgi:hypothetical protein